MERGKRKIIRLIKDFSIQLVEDDFMSLKEFCAVNHYNYDSFKVAVCKAKRTGELTKFYKKKIENYLESGRVAA